MSRKNLIPLLLDQPRSVSQLAKQTGAKPKDVEDDLEHLLKSLKHMDYTIIVQPASCRKCGFQFSQTKLGRPSKCPACHGTWLFEAQISLHKKL